MTLFLQKSELTTFFCVCVIVFLLQSCIDNREDMLKVLLDNGADVNIQDREMWTPLHAASTCGHRDLTAQLITR